MRPVLALGLLAAALLLAPPASSGVIVVDRSGGGDFTTVQAAVDASADGDTILVRPGDYVVTQTDLVQLGAHSLVLVADQGGEVRLPLTAVSNLAADDVIVLRGFRFGPSGLAGLFLHNLLIGGCEGAVFVEDCVSDGLPGFSGGLTSTAGKGAVRVGQSDAVTFQRCTFTGGSGAHTDPNTFPFPSLNATSGAPALTAIDSRIALYDCTLAGGHGGHDNAGLAAPGGDGADALLAQDGSSVTLSGTVLVGGDAGNGCAVDQPGCTAGDGVHVVSAGQVRTLDVDAQGGAGGLLEGGAGSTPDGQPVLADGAAVHVPYAGQAVSLWKDGPLRSGELGTLNIEGPEGALFMLFAGLEPGFLPLPHFKGVLAAGLPLQGPWLFSFIPRGGVLAANFVAPDLTPFGLDALLLVDQLIVDQGAAGVILSSPTSHVQVGPEF